MAAAAAGKPSAGVHGGGFEQLRSLLWRARARPAQTPRQLRPILRFGNNETGVMTCRSRLAP